MKTRLTHSEKTRLEEWVTLEFFPGSKIFGFSSDHIANRWAFASLKLERTLVEG
jgi:hypothetical protein